MENIEYVKNTRINAEVYNAEVAFLLKGKDLRGQHLFRARNGNCNDPCYGED